MIDHQVLAEKLANEETLTEAEKDFVEECFKYGLQKLKQENPEQYQAIMELYLRILKRATAKKLAEGE